ncbi:MAG TPA: aminotransferase class I/II-fold pyridoxal phosphate-dependent enzyme [Solirubrobacter sp.]|nr:aminotransferase class I/II-fold pyridoxal phosphate-dependent enzyme [Solirubrobacter sp.]
MLTARSWLPPGAARRVDTIAAQAAEMTPATVAERLHDLVDRNRTIHSVECINLNPASNVMNPRAEALLAAGLGTRASLGYPGEKYETGLEAIEEIEVLAASLAADVFGATHVELRVPSGALANLYGFIATCSPGDTIIAPPAAIGGHVTHHPSGAAGLYGLEIVEAPVSAHGYTVDVDALAELAARVRPRLITIGGSLNLQPHPVAAIRELADAVGAKVLFDAAHLSGLFAGGAWPNPLAEGAHLMTMSTYKSLAGPPGGLVVTNDAELAERLEGIAYPGLTANFDVGKTAALALTLVDWSVAGRAYAQAMIENAAALVRALDAAGVPIFQPTTSHQLAVDARTYGGGDAAARRLRRANLLASAIGLPGDGDGLRLGTPEITRIGMTAADMTTLADFIARGLTDPDPERVGREVSAWRGRFDRVHFTAA